MPGRKDGYADIRDYAVIGDGRTVALVARDGAIDWLCLPALDSPSVFGALLDADRGGAFTLAPATPFDATRRYLPSTNVLETTFRTDTGVVRVTDAMTLPGAGLSPFRELARRIEGVAGCVAMRWQVTPRFGYGAWPVRVGTCGPAITVSARQEAVAVAAWGAGAMAVDGGAITGEADVREGERAMIVMTAASQEPLVVPRREEVERRLDATIAFWARWANAAQWSGPWKDAVVRSALTLKLLVHAPSGAVAAAPTMSLPETVGGERNWDYRFCWIRDSAFTLDALLQLGFHDEAHAFFWWFMHTTALTHPRVHVVYRLDGSPHLPERTIPLAGYRGSRPVRMGNSAADQLQLDVYGDLFHTAWLYVDHGYPIDRDTGRELAEIADLVCDLWHEPDRGIWEVRAAPRHYTQSKAMCWVALDRACRLAARGALPSRGVERWRAQAAAISRFIEERCWSERERSYAWYAGSDDLDASLLLLPVMEYGAAAPERMASTVDAVRRGLGRGALVARYRGADGLSGQEGHFACCSFWLVHALALAGRNDEAAQVMDEMLALGNDLGLFAEEIDADTAAFLGNFPQGLVHLALINAALALAAAGARR